MRAFEGIRVLDLTHVFAGPFCTFQLAVMGADVIKIESPDFPDMMRDEGNSEALNELGLSNFFVCQNSEKKSLSLNLKSDDDREFFLKLVRTADVLVQNYSGKAMERLGFSYKKLKKINSKLIYCSMTGFGKTGPKAEHPAYDSVIQAYSGLMELNGLKSTGPLRVGPAIVDYGTGIHAAFAISSALFRREITGEGLEIDLSMLDAAFMLMTSTVSDTLASGISKPSYGNNHPDYAGYGAYNTSDRMIVIGAFTKKQLNNLFLALELTEQAERVSTMSKAEIKDNNSRFRTIIESVIETNTADYWETKLNSFHVPAAKVRTLVEALASDQVKSRQVLQNSLLAEHSDQPTLLPTAAFSYSQGSPRITKAAPRINRDGGQIEKEVGDSLDVKEPYKI